MNLYRQKGDYENAVKTGTSLLKNYPEQAKEKNIKKTIEEISYLASGESEKTAGFMTTFINEGRMTTLTGRKAGFEVAKSYISVPSTKEEGAKLLQEFISMAEKSSSKNEEIDNLASAYYLIGTYYREKLDYKKASSNFLLSAQYYASFDKEFSARALYGAIESFDCNSSFADSKQTYFTLKEKYPQSHWTQRAYSVVSEYLE
jgi:tetratricopeptide (TPR) repeat protein